VAETFQVPYLGEVPLDASVRQAGDAGEPVVLAQPEGPVARAFQEIAGRLAAAVATRQAHSLPVLQ